MHSRRPARALRVATRFHARDAHGARTHGACPVRLRARCMRGSVQPLSELLHEKEKTSACSPPSASTSAILDSPAGRAHDALYCRAKVLRATHTDALRFDLVVRRRAKQLVPHASDRLPRPRDEQVPGLETASSIVSSRPPLPITVLVPSCRLCRAFAEAAVSPNRRHVLSTGLVICIESVVIAVGM